MEDPIRSPDIAEHLSWSGAGRLRRGLFPPIVALQGTGPVVLVDALGRSTADILAALPALPERSVVLTNDPHLAPLRAAQVVYEYAPLATPDGARPAERLSDRITWIDDVYGLDEIRTLPQSR
ncbi:hypothetical protein [Ilumatobacter sp.]|uniref:hypothetical protein n=1 Tax=Ilumatobacter sp. TaxID=1967498 RepID=UPI003C375DCC